jgi:Methyl-accepting chemotaxis protein
MLFSSKVQGTDWYMFLEVPVSEYTASLNQLMNIVIAVTFAAILILVVILIIILRSFFSRLSKLSYLSGNVAEGNLTVSLPESADELGVINTAFNKMIGNLKNIVIKIKKVSEVIVASSSTYKNVSDEVIESGKSMQQSIDEITKGAKSTTEEIQNITVSIHDMESRSKELVEISENIDSMISQTKSKTTEGSKSLTDTVKELHRMKESVDTSSGVITDLSEKSDIIANISTTISSISQQTNLLALNASIEASRAGESGKGFSVVAEEIRKLAEQSSKAAQNISQEVQQIRQQIVNAVNSMSDSIRYVNSGTGSIDQIQNIFSGISLEIENVKALSTTIFEIAKMLLEENKKINEAVCNTSAISEESVACTLCFQDMINNQENLFTDLKKASVQLDELTLSLFGEISSFKL